MNSNNGIPKGWQVHTLGDVVDVRFSSVDKKTRDGEEPVRLCNYMDVWKNSYIHDAMPFMKATASKSDVTRFALQTHDVLLTKDSETKHEIAQPSVVKDVESDVVLGYHLALLRPKPDQAYGPFISAQLSIPEFRRQFIRNASGATRFGLGIDTVKQGIVWLPDVEEQKQISRVLISVDKAIEKTRDVIDQTRNLKTALLQDLLTRGLPGKHTEFLKHKHLGTIPTEWDVVKLESLIDPARPVCYGILMPGTGHPGGVPVVKVKDIMDGLVKSEGLLLTTPELDEEYRRSRLIGGDLLLSIRGSTGRVGIVPDKLTGANITQDTARLACMDIIIRDWLYYILQGHELQSYVQQHTIGQAVKGINIAEVRKIPIPLPDEDERKKIVDLFHAIEARLNTESDRLKRLIKSKTALSQALLVGRKRVLISGGVP